MCLLRAWFEFRKSTEPGRKKKNWWDSKNNKGLRNEREKLSSQESVGAAEGDCSGTWEKDRYPWRIKLIAYRLSHEYKAK